MADGTVKIETELDNTKLKNGLSQMTNDLNSATKTVSNSSKEMGDNVEKETEKSTTTMKDKLKAVAQVAGSTMLGIGKTVGTGLVTAISATGTALSKLGVASTQSYASLEQNVGGIETLFKGSAQKVIDNANNAYKTAGMSANQYMETVTGFSASLLQSLGGDTDKAADVANMALTDMSDNANKMGTSMESIQYAYQGFAKQNYTMLDNLKLGYGGTKEEMQRLLDDATKITGVKYDINNLNDVYQAIHVIQGELGITGTTAQEAATTIEGSVNSMKSAWDNFLNGSGDLSTLVEAAQNAGNNIITAATQLIFNIVNQVASAGPAITTAVIGLVDNLSGILFSQGPILINTILQIFQNILNTIPQILPQIIQTAITLIMTFIQGLLSMLPQIITIGVTVITQLILGITQMLPQLMLQAVEAITTIVMGLLDNIDQLIDAGIQLLIALAVGLINAIPQLIDKIPIIIEKLLTAIANNFPKLLAAGVKLIFLLATGLIQGVPQLLSKIPSIIGSMVGALGKGIGKFVEIGGNMIQGIWQGISNMASWVFDKISGFCKGIVDKVKGLFGIHSPSKVFNKEIGKFLALGLGEGFDQNIGNVYKDMKEAVDFETQKLGTNLSTTANYGKNISLAINVQGDTYMDSTKVGRIITPKVAKTLRGVGAYA